MAYTSFSLRRTISDGGSALRRTNVSQDASNPTGSGDAVYDSGLRAEGYTPPLPLAALQSSFSAEIYKRGEIELRWELTTPLVIAPEGEAYEPTSLVIRASDYGEPVTPESGIPVIEVTALNYTDVYVDIAGPSRPYIAEGKWAYYSLFVEYTSSVGGSFYEKVAELSVQTPYDFGSFQALWSRVPTYYRELDYSYALTDPNSVVKEDPNDPESPFVGPLYRFVELFAWELDKMRTTIFDTMRINDPEVVHSSAIDALAYQVGVTLTKDALGTDKLRALLNNIGYLRRTKGTIGSVEAFISALSGCGVTSRYDAVNDKWIFDVHPMRVNLITDPFFSQGVTDSDETLVTDERIFRWWTDLSDAGRTYGWGVWASIPDAITANVTQNTDNDRLTLVFPQATAADQFGYVLFYSRGAYQYREASNLTFYGSCDEDRLFDVFLGFGAAFLDGVVEVTPPTLTLKTVSDAVTGLSPDLSNSSRSIFANVEPTLVLPEVISAYPVFIWKVALSTTEATTFSITNPLFEYKNSSGEFFSGSTTNGGYIPNALGGAGDGIYDYHWGTLSAASGPGTDFSYYTLDIYRVQRITENIIETSVIPVNKVKNVDYQINWEVLE